MEKLLNPDFFKRIFNDAPVAIELFDKNGFLLDCNQACLDLFGIGSVNEVTGFNLFEDPHLSYKQKEDIKAGKNIRFIVEFSFEVVKELKLYNTIKSGVSYLDCSAASIFSEEHEITGFLFYILDISDSKKAEIAVNENKEKYINLFEANTDGITIFKINPDNTTSRFIEMNENAARLIGYSIDEMLTMYPSDVEKINSEEVIIERIRELKEKGYANFETIITHKNGQDIPVEIKVKIINYHNQPAIMNITRDISERKKKETQLQEFANELNRLISDKDKFISILAHDLKSPFNSLLGFSDLLVENVRSYDIDKIEKQVKLINQVSHQTFNLLEEILIWAKSQSGKLKYEPERMDFFEISNQIVNSFINSAKGKNISVTCLGTQNPTIIADLNMYKTVLRNLLSNALKYTNQGGFINVYAEAQGEHVVITVSDNGIGIETGQMSKLWEIADHFSTPGTDNERGTGFGLILCRELIEKQGGRIWVESQTGKGSDFKFVLPLFRN